MKRLAAFLSALLIAGGAFAVICPNAITTRAGKGSSLTWAEVDANFGNVSAMCTPADTWVVGPASATDNAICRYDATTGKLVQDSALTVSDLSGNAVTLSAPSAATPTAVTITAGPSSSAMGGVLTLRSGSSASSASGASTYVYGADGNGSATSGGGAVLIGGNGGSGGFGGGAAIYGANAPTAGSAGYATVQAGAGASGGGGGTATVVGGQGGSSSGVGGSTDIKGGPAGSGGNGGVVTVIGGAGSIDGNGGDAVLKGGPKSGTGTHGSAIVQDNTGTNKLTCDSTSCTPAGTWDGVRDNVPLAHGRSPFAIAAGAGAADDCLIAGTNLGTAYKGWGGPATVKMDGFSRVILYCRAKNAGGQSGTISCQLQNLTDGTTTVSAATSTSTTCTTLTNTATGVALTGAKSFECQIKSSVATDDPLFGSCTMALEP